MKLTQTYHLIAFASVKFYCLITLINYIEQLLLTQVCKFYYFRIVQYIFCIPYQLKFRQLKVMKFLKNFVTFNHQNFLNNKINDQQKFLTNE